jgi:GAF domain-containing protein
MAETLLDVRHEPKPRAYELVTAAFDQVMGDTDDPVTAMATMSALLHHGFGFLWTGFYRLVAPDLLRVGPYQGTLGCLEIALGRGVCGTAAAERRTVIVPDVNEFPGHITCDARSRSEIVVPVAGPEGDLLAVLDIDSERTNRFDADDQAGLERLVSWFADAAHVSPR